MTAADKQLETAPEQFPATPYIPAQDKRIVWRGGSYKLDNGYCPGTRVVAYFVGRGPRCRRSATRTRCPCPSSSARRSTRRTRRSPQQPLGSELIGVPAKAGKRPGYVVKQEPRNGYLSANATVRLYVTRPDPRFGLLPNLVGSSLTAARARLRALKARTTITYDKGPAGSVLEQTPEPGRRRRARAQGHAGRGPRLRRPARTPDHVAPRQIDRLRDPDPRRRDDLDLVSGGGRARTAARERAARRQRRRSRVPGSAGPGPSRAARSATSPRRARIWLEPVRRLERAEQHCGRDPSGLADDVDAPVDPVRAVDVEGSRTQRTSPRSAASGPETRGSPDRRARTPRPRRSSLRRRRGGTSSRAARARPRDAPGEQLQRGQAPSAKSCGCSERRLRSRAWPRPGDSAPISSRIVSCVREATIASGHPLDPDERPTPVPALLADDRLERVDPVGAHVLAEAEKDHPRGVAHRRSIARSRANSQAASADQERASTRDQLQARVEGARDRPVDRAALHELLESRSPGRR